MMKRLGKSLLKIVLFIVAVAIATVLIGYLLLNILVSREPQELGIDGRGNLYIIELLSSQIRKFNAEGELKATIGGGFPLGSKRSYARSITIDPVGNLYFLSDIGEVTKYSPDGTALLSWKGDGERDATKIAIDSKGNIFIGYSGNKLFQKFDTQGKLLKEWVAPHPLAVDNNGYFGLDKQDNLYVVDSEKKLLNKYDGEGNLLSTISGIKDLYKPFLVDQNGYIYTFSSAAIVQKWDWNGSLVKTWGGRGSEPGQFEYKYSYSSIKGIVTDDRDQIYILYKNNDQSIVQQYTTDGRFIRRWTDGFPNGTWYLFQILGIGGLFLIIWIVAKAVSIGKPTDLLKPIPLPKQVLEAVQTPELLRDNIGTNSKPEGKASKKSNKTKEDLLKTKVSRTYLEQALGTFDNPEAEKGLRPNQQWSLRLIISQLGILWGWFLLPFALFMNGWFSQLNKFGWLVATFFAAAIFVVFAAVVLWNGRKSGVGRPRLTRSDIAQLFAINALCVAAYAGLAYLIHLAGMFIFGRGDIDTYVIFYGMVFMVTMLTGLFVFGCTITANEKLWLNAPYNAGKYELTLRRTGAMRRIFNTAGLWILEAEAYRRMGKLDEAEKVYYEAMTHAAHHQATPAALLLEGLALVRMEQERYPESLYLLEKSYDLNPERNSPFVYGAENYIRARLKNERAWQLLEQAKSVNENKAMKATRLSLEALLLGREKWFDQAQYFIENALDSADPKFKPGVAEIHLRAAIIADMQGNDKAALEHYRQVQLNDPFGVNGTRASRILRFSPKPAPQEVSLS
jgi:hypothetical protein